MPTTHPTPAPGTNTKPPPPNAHGEAKGVHRSPNPTQDNKYDYGGDATQSMDAPPVLTFNVSDFLGQTDGGPAFLTPEAMMAYCQSRLGSLDSQVKEVIAKQNHINDEQQIVGQLLQEFQGCALGTNGKQDPAMCSNLETSIENAIDAIKKLDPSSPAIADLEKLHDNVVATGTGPTGSHQYYNGVPDGAKPDNQIDGTEIKNFTDALTQTNSTLNSGAEMNMITVQSVMSQRQSAIQLTTNIIQSLGDQYNKIVANIGH
jgi:hypothetical protein